MFIQLFEFAGWAIDIYNIIAGNPNAVPVDSAAWGFLAAQTIIFAYCANFLYSKQFPLYTVFYGFYWVDFVFSIAIFAYVCIVTFLNNDALADLAVVVVMTVFYGSDILMAGGMLYVMKNYIPVAPITPAPVQGQYILMNANGVPMLYQAQPVYLPHGVDEKQIIMV